MGILYIGPIFIRMYVICITKEGSEIRRVALTLEGKVSDTKTFGSLKTFLNREGLSRSSKSENR